MSEPEGYPALVRREVPDYVRLVVVPENPADVVTPLEPGFDQPSTVAEQLRWRAAAGLRPRVAWVQRDLAVLAATRSRAVASHDGSAVVPLTSSGGRPWWSCRFAFALVLCAAVAGGGCATKRPVPASQPTGTTSIVIPRLVRVDVANAIAEVSYLGMIAVLVDRDHRPFFYGGDDHPRCRVSEQDPRPKTEVVAGDLTVTVTLTVGC
jgi:hypothetical protein